MIIYTYYYFFYSAIAEEEEEEEGKPTFTGKPLIKQSPDFNSIIFECQLTADPKPTLQW